MYKHARKSPRSRVRVRTDTSCIDDGPTLKQREAKAAWDARVERDRERERQKSIAT